MRQRMARGICNKPRVKCGDCLSQAFIPITDRVILDHLQGRCVVGVYSLLADESCHFLAVDFDKGHWRDDVTAFAATFRLAGGNRAIAVGQRRARVVLLFGTHAGERGAEDGMLPADRNHGGPS